MIYLDGQPTAEFVPEIADNLTTDDSSKALSAKQGKVLKDKIDSLIKVEQTTISVTVSANSHLWSGRVKPSDTSYSWYLYSVIPLDAGLIVAGYNDDGILVRNVTNSPITANLNQRWFGILN